VAFSACRDHIGDVVCNHSLSQFFKSQSVTAESLFFNQVIPCPEPLKEDYDSDFDGDIDADGPNIIVSRDGTFYPSLNLPLRRIQKDTLLKKNYFLCV